MNRAAPKVAVFDANLLGRSLKQMSTKTVNTGAQDVTSSWYHSERDADLYIWKDERSNIIKQQFLFLGQVVEWNIIEGTRTGLMVDEGEADGSGTVKPTVLFDQVRQPYTVEQVVGILKAVQDLSDSERRQLIKNFAESPNFADLRPEEVLALYGRPNNLKNRLMAWFDRVVFLFQFGRKR